MAVDVLKKINSEITKLPESKQLLIAKMIIDRLANKANDTKNPLAEVWGKWPGNESIDEILKVLEQTSREEA